MDCRKKHCESVRTSFCEIEALSYMFFELHVGSFKDINDSLIRRDRKAYRDSVDRIKC